MTAYSSSYLDYFGEGLAADRPVTPDVSPAAIALYYSTDTLVLELWDGSAWVTIASGAGVWTAGSVTTVGPDLALNSGTLDLHTIAAHSLFGNPGTAAATPSAVAIGTGLTLTAGGTIAATAAAAQWTAGTITALGANLTNSSGTLVATDTNTNIWNAGTVTSVGTNLSLSAGTLTATDTNTNIWNAGTVTNLGPGITLTTGTLDAAIPEWTAGTITALGANLTNSSGTLVATDTNTNIWNAGTVTTIGAGVTLTAGTLTAAGGAGSVTSVATGAGLSGGPITTAGTVVADWHGGTVAALGTGISLVSGTLSATGSGGSVTSVVSGAGLHAGTISTTGTLQADWQGGTITALGANLTNTSGTLAATDTNTNIWNAGTVTTIASGLTLTAGTLDISSTTATKTYVDTAVNPAIVVQAATTGVLPNTPTYNNGASGVGATLTAGSVGTLTVDGYAAILGSRLLIKDQASSFQNGVYIVTTAGTAGVAYVLTRAANYNTPATISATAPVPVSDGVANKYSSWLAAGNIVTVGTDALTFVQMTSPVLAPVQTLGSGLVLNAGTINVASVAAGHLIANSTSATANATDTTLTALIDRAIGSTQGQILYRSASAWSALATGTSGQVLTAGGAAANPAWSTSPIGAATPVAMIRNSGTQAIGGSANTTVTFGTSVFDTGAFFPGSGNAFVVPTNMNYVRLSASVHLNAGGTSGIQLINFALNGTIDGARGFTETRVPSNTNVTYLNVTSGVVPVSNGDTLTVNVFLSNANTILADNQTYFTIERVG